MNSQECIFLSILILCITILIIFFAKEPDLMDRIINFEDIIRIKQNRFVPK
jgi:hypothetical protein